MVRETGHIVVKDPRSGRPRVTQTRDPPSLRKELVSFTALKCDLSSCMRTQVAIHGCGGSIKIITNKEAQ